MTTPVLGTMSFSSTPDVNGDPVMLNTGSTPSISSDALANRPAAGSAGAIFVDTSNNVIYRATGSAWELLSPNNPIMPIYYGTVEYQSGTSLIPADSSTPLSTEGTQLWAQTLTPTSSSSKFALRFDPFVDSGNNGRFVTVSLFRDTTCLYAVANYVTTASRGSPLTVHVVDAPGVTTAVTYSCRIGVNSSGYWYVAGNPAITFGTAGAAGWSIIEYA